MRNGLFRKLIKMLAGRRYNVKVVGAKDLPTVKVFVVKCFVIVILHQEFGYSNDFGSRV